MSDSLSTPIDDQAKKDRNRKRKALLAGGLVLGIGAAATLAAFTDSEFAKGTFSTGNFNIVGSTDNNSFSDHATAGSAPTLSFTTSATGMTPGDSIYSSYFIKTGTGSLGGTLTDGTATKGSTNTALEGLLTPSVKYIPAATACDATSFANGTSSPSSLESGGQNTVHACINVKLSDVQSDVQNAGTADATITWQWTATSA